MKKIFALLFLSVFLVSCGNTWELKTPTTKIENKTEEKKLASCSIETEEIVENTTNSWSLVSSGTTQTWQTENLKNNIKKMKKELKNGSVVAFMKTTKWQVEIFLETEKAPFTTANFIGLAKKWYYNGIIFHRVIKDFMIQGWDPEGTGMGGTSIYGEKFKDEFDETLKNNKFTISMANAWADTNGSQFFINVADNNFLDFKHSVFGEVISGKENVLNISKVKTNSSDKPENEVKIISLEIKECQNGKFVDYNFDEKKAVEDYKKVEEEKKNSPVKAWDTVSVHYTWTFEDGKKFDSSYDRGQTLDFEVGSWMMISGFDEAVVGMKIWEKKSVTLAPEKAYWAYDKEKIQTMPRADLKAFEDAGIKLEAWETLPTQYWEFVIVEANEKEVKVDLNHSLAGKTLKFDIELVNKK